MAIDFPSSPAVNQQYIYGGVTYTFTSQGVWVGGITAATQPAINCGRLDFVSATQLSFKPYNGDRIKINGTLYQIPSAGIAGLGNTGVYVNGVAGQNLAAWTVYRVYAFNNGGTITADFSTAVHATSATAGNIGTEIKSSDDTRTLIGMVWTDGTGNFLNSQNNRGTISWFNRRNLSCLGNVTSVSTTSTTSIELNSAASRMAFLVWADEHVFVSLSGLINGTTQNAAANGDIGLDGVIGSMPQNPYVQIPTASIWCAYAGYSMAYQLSEGMHFVSPFGCTSSGTIQFNLYCSGVIRG
jgi:hypothetical protein